MSNKEYQRRRSFLQKVITPREAQKIDALHDNLTDYCLTIDSLLLGHVLSSAGISLPPQELSDEVQNWDRDHLSDLAENVQNYTRNADDVEKLKFIIEHSMSEDLVEVLADPKADNPYSKYNHQVLSAMDNLGANVKNWLGHEGNLSHSQSFNPKHPFSFNMVEWRRDFRREYATGNISECCIAVDDKSEYEKFKPVLLDYFLDLSVKVFKMKKDRIDVGQVYLVALDHEGIPCMGISSVEIAEAYRNDDDLVTPAMVLLIGSSNTYQSQYGFKKSIVGDRFGVFKKYVNRRRELISNLKANLSRKRNALKQQIHAAKLTGNSVLELDESRIRIGQEIDLLERQYHQLPERRATVVAKAGLREAIESGVTYLGTNYLDLFAKKDEEGFFQPSQHLPKELKRYPVEDGIIFAGIESTLASLRSVYSKRYANF